MNRTNKIVFILFISVFLAGCSATKYVGKDEFLLEKVTIQRDDRSISRSDLRRTIRQKPNTRILGISRFHLGLYNLSGRDEAKNSNRWLRRIGEEPVIFSPFLTEQSAQRMTSFLHNRGYYEATVRESVTLRRRKAYVTYRVEAGPVTRIGEISFKNRSQSHINRQAEESGLLDNYYRDTLSTLLRTGDPLDMDVLDKERDRITLALRGHGFFNFSKNYIQFFADSSVTDGKKTAPLYTRIMENTVDSTIYSRYRIRTISVDFDYDPLLHVSGGDTLIHRMPYEGYTIHYRKELNIRPRVIIETIQMVQGEWYDVRQVQETYSRLQALNLFRFVNIDFKEVEEAGERYLDCVIQLTPLKRQSYNLFTEGTNTGGNLGVGGNLVYSHRNLFRGGENFTVSLRGALKKEQVDDKGSLFNSYELGAEVRLVTPQFWLPFLRLPHFRRDYAPRTSVSLAYSFENTPYYARSVATARFGYLWRKADKKWRYNLDVVDLNYVWMKNIDTEFRDSMKNEYIKSAYVDHMIFSAVFSAVYSDQLSGNSRSSYNYFRAGLESSGNLLWGIDRLTDRDRETGDANYPQYFWLGVPYAQFVKADAEYRYSWQVNHANALVWRFLVGCGVPYGNMKVLPFEESFYAGGANDLRAWQARTLGPGSYYEEKVFPNSVGDFKLALNMEYRFKLAWLLEGALFVDAGNIWNITPKENRQGSKLTAGFYKQLAVGTGAGIRINANYFLLRFDWGFKVNDPAQPEGKRFILFDTEKGGFKGSVFNVAIGYPF